MYGAIIGGSTTGAGASAALASTGFNTLAVIVGAATLIAAGLSVWKLAPRFRRGDR
jgi:hypothetical protein